MKIPKSISRPLLLALFGLVAVPSPGLPQSAPSNLSQMSIEDLLNIEVTSASRKEQRASDVAAAVFVITHDDIHRSGMTTIPDLLRQVPGVQVAQINSNKWAVSVRGFNGLYANKLLVLVDGRSVYNRIFSGVFWDTEHLMLDDIDRIEVVRGPGAAMWGANAVNGVINIVTKAAADTQGVLARVDGGRSSEQAVVRYGGTLGATPYRLYAQWTGLEESLTAPGTRANDASRSITTGFRADWTTQPGALTLEGDFTAGEGHALWPNFNRQTAAGEPFSSETSERRAGHLLGRLTHTRAGGASLQMQSYVDIGGRQEPVGNYDRRTFEIDTQYHMPLGPRQDLVAGVGYRFSGERFAGNIGFSLTPAEDNSSLLTAFVQDDIALFEDRLTLMLGSQVQRDSHSGAGLQPTARVMWKALPRQRLWAATSRALRTPSMYERRIRVDLPAVRSANGLPLVATLVGNAGAQTENLVDAEAGYRLEIGTAASIDATGFVGRYDHLRTQEPGAPVVQFAPSPQIVVTSRFGNQLEATTRGLEIAGQLTPVQAWRLSGSYTAFRIAPRLAALSRDPVAASEDGNAPRTQWQVRSAFSPGSRATLDVAIFHVSRLEQLHVDPYTRADINAEWRFNSGLSAMAVVQNLFDPAHAEFAGPGAGSLLLATQVPRSASLRLRWTLR